MNVLLPRRLALVSMWFLLIYFNVNCLCLQRRLTINKDNYIIFSLLVSYHLESTGVISKQ